MEALSVPNVHRMREVRDICLAWNTTEGLSYMVRKVYCNLQRHTVYGKVAPPICSARQHSAKLGSRYFSNSGVDYKLAKICSIHQI